jgi:hypothetical protein
MKKLFPVQDGKTPSTRFLQSASLQKIWPLLTQLETKDDELLKAAEKSKKKQDSLSWFKYKHLREALEKAYYLITNYNNASELTDLGDSFLNDMLLLANLLGVFESVLNDSFMCMPRSQAKQTINSGIMAAASITGTAAGLASSGPVGGAGGFFAGAAMGNWLRFNTVPETYQLCKELKNVIAEELQLHVFKLNVKEPVSYRIVNSEPGSISLYCMDVWRDGDFKTEACYTDSRGREIKFSLPNTAYLLWWPRLADGQSKGYAANDAYLSLKAMVAMGVTKHFKELQANHAGETEPHSGSYQCN